MIDFQFEDQKNINQNFQSVCYSRFSIINIECHSEEQIVDQFIHSTKFSIESLPDVKKQDLSNAFLKQAFDPLRLSIQDFKKTSKDHVIKYLTDLENDNNWGETDQEDFILLKNQYLNLLDTIETDCFFILSKDWFSIDDNKLRDPENWVYIYYFIIISVDIKNSMLSISEWTYD